MHIELAELLRCPEPHEEAFCVVSADTMENRLVLSGTLGCPVCHNEYEIRDGVTFFAAESSTVSTPTRALPADGPTTQALLNLSGPGGNVALVGSAALLASDLAAQVDGVHFVACNAPENVQGSSRVSLLQAPESIPLRTSSMRGIVLGAELVREPWIEEAVRVLLRGTRFVSFGDLVCPEGLGQLAASDGMVVGEKT